MGNNFLKGALSFRKMDELVVLLAVFFFIFGCVIIPEPPFPVELTAFSDLSTEKTLQFDSPGDTDSFQLNISRYTTVGNSSKPLGDNPGVVQNFSMLICPTEHMGSNASNLTLHWPTGGSTLFYEGTLDSCQYVSINASEFNSYLAVHQAPSMANFIMSMAESIDDGLVLEWGISQKNPKMQDMNSPVTYQLMILEPSVPEDLIEQIVEATTISLPAGFDLMTDAKLSGLSYTCYDWDQVRETTSPSAIYPIQMSVPGMNLSNLPIPIDLDIPNGTIILNATVFDLDCPPYGTPGKYRAQVRRMLLDLNNYTGPVPTVSFTDDFDSPALNPAWLFFGTTGTALGWYDDNHAMSRVDLYSQGNASGSSMFLYLNHSIDGSGGSLIIEANISSAGQPGVDISSFPEGVGLVGFATNTSYPGPVMANLPQIRGAIAFGNNLSLIICPDGEMAFATPTSSDYHLFKINITNDTATYYIDGVQVFQCLNETSDELYPMISADHFTDAFHGDVFVDWVNATSYSGGPGTWSEDWNEFDHFDSPLDTGKWLMRNVSFYGTGVATYNYQPALSKIDLISEPSPPGGVNTANLLYFNQEISAPTTNESGVYVVASIYLDESNPNAAPGLFFANETVAPTDFSSSLNHLRGGIVYSQDYLVFLCPDFTEAVMPINLTEAAKHIDLLPITGWHDIGYYSTNDTVVFIYDGIPFPTNCSAHNESFYVVLTSDPVTDQMYGNTSIGRFEFYAVEYETEYYGDKWFDLGLLAYMEYINNSIYSDVIVFDANAEGDFYGRLFDFEVSSDTPGIVEVSDLNISYGSLISYGPAGTAPTTRLDPNSDFSWFAVNSEFYNSDLRLNSFAYNSTLVDSELVLSRVDCMEVINSRLVFSGAVYSTEEQYLGSSPLLPINLSELETDCSGTILNSNLEFVFLFGGNVYNSDIKTLPLIATDFENAVFDNFTLYEGRMVINGTRAPSIFSDESTLDTIMLGMTSAITDNGTLLFGCSEESTIAMDSVANIHISDAPAASLNCRFELHNSNLTLQNLTFRNEFGGIRVSLDNSSTRISNMPELVNVTTYGQLTDVVIWNLNTSLLSGPLVMSSEGIYVETGMASANDSYPETNLTEVTSLFQVSLIFNNVGEWDGNITYYDEFTTNKTEAMEQGIECPIDRCYYSHFDPVAHILRVDVSNFSTYVVNYTIWNDTNDTNATPRPRTREREYTLLVEGECAGQEVIFTALDDNFPLDEMYILIRGPSSNDFYASMRTDASGKASFVPSTAATYTYLADNPGYETHSGILRIIDCEEVSEIYLPATPVPEPEPPEPECIRDSDCDLGYWCKDGKCVMAIDPPKESEEEPVPPKPIVEIPSLPPVEAPVSPPTEEPAPQACCLAGICMELLGICWYYWLLGLILLLAAAGIYYFASKKK